MKTLKMYFSLSAFPLLQINLKIGMCGMKANLMTVIRRLAYHFQKKFFVLVPLWTTIIMLFVRTSYPDMPPGVALPEACSTTHRVTSSEMAD